MVRRECLDEANPFIDFQWEEWSRPFFSVKKVYIIIASRHPKSPTVDTFPKLPQLAIACCSFFDEWGSWIQVDKLDQEWGVGTILVVVLGSYFLILRIARRGLG